MQLKVFSRQSHAFAWLCAYFLDWLSLAFGIRLVKLLVLRPARKSALAAALFHIVGTYLYKVCALTHTHTNTAKHTLTCTKQPLNDTATCRDTQYTATRTNTHACLPGVKCIGVRAHAYENRFRFRFKKQLENGARHGVCCSARTHCCCCCCACCCCSHQIEIGAKK